MEKLFTEWLRMFGSNMAKELDREILDSPHSAPSSDAAQSGSAKNPPPHEEKYWLCVPDQWNSKRWKDSEGNGYRGEIFRLKCCCKRDAYIKIDEMHPDVRIIAVFEDTEEQRNQIPYTHQIVEA